MNEELKKMLDELELTLKDMPDDAREFALLLANFEILLEASKCAFKIMMEHKGDFEK